MQAWNVYFDWRRRTGAILRTIGIRYSVPSAGVLCLAGLLLLGIAPATAKADVDYDVNAVVGNIAYGGPAGQYTGLSVTGTLDLTAIINDFGTGSGTAAASITVQGDPNVFTGVLDCRIYTCASFYNSGFTEFGALNIGDPFTFTGGALGQGSYIALTNPLGSGPAEVAYDLTGTITPAGGSFGNNQNPTVTPEPSLAGVVTLCLGGVFAIVLHRRRQRA